MVTLAQLPLHLLLCGLVLNTPWTILVMAWRLGPLLYSNFLNSFSEACYLDKGHLLNMSSYKI